MNSSAISSKHVPNLTMSLSDWPHSSTLHRFFLSDRPEPKFGKKDLECCFSHKLTRVQTEISVCLFTCLWKSLDPLIYQLFISPGQVSITHNAGSFIIPYRLFFPFAHPRPGNGWLKRANILLSELFSVRSSNFVNFHAIFGFKFSLYYRFNSKPSTP